ncbi:hypothetical protein KY342_02395 [Candidatus Woesearchaeota archaeon]|nr:hypothetical protein [Candidatus Woesearchaeota archaeon]
MNKKAQNLLGQAIVFLGLWLITSLIWSIWLDGILVPAVGCVTSLAVVGVNIAIHLHR